MRTDQDKMNDILNLIYDGWRPHIARAKAHVSSQEFARLRRSNPEFNEKVISNLKNPHNSTYVEFGFREKRDKNVKAAILSYLASGDSVHIALKKAGTTPTVHRRLKKSDQEYKKSVEYYTKQSQTPASFHPRYRSYSNPKG